MSEVVDCDYSIQGSGPALFLSHGIGAAKNAWRFLLPELSKHFTVVTYDLRGHGKSPVTNKNFTLDDLVLDLEKIREKTKIDKAHFAGHSLGGMIAPAYSIKFPNRVLSVGLLSTVAGRSDVDKNNVLKIISEMETTSVEQTLQKLTTRWFTDEFIEENPDLVKLKNKYSSEDFEIVGVSLDRDKNAWTTAIINDNIENWVHISNLKFWGEPIAKLYGLLKMPTSYLLDANRNVIGIDLKGDELDKSISDQINK